ncbi:transposase [Salinimonas marina]|uniref:Transposase n=1 Tax=Salinimonas marina TaxID=2785918 RepID=A0A7S9HDH6_9ALTE|nr:transposase [Salinimonas marina]
MFLAKIFAVDVCAYAVMSNHTHVVLRINTAKARQWSHEKTLRNWQKLHRGTVLCQRYLNDKSALTHNELNTVQATVEVYRGRLQCISWFMRELNEFIARRANKEDECTGRFWEGRFKSQALLDEASVLACMAYVDLNPVRAGKARSIKNLLYTSLNRRLIARKAGRPAPGLLPLRTQRKPDTFQLWFSLQTYLQLLRWSFEHYTNNVKDPPSRPGIPELLEQCGLGDKTGCRFAMGLNNNVRAK